MMRVVGLAGWSGSGKTTLLTRLIPVLRAEGLAVSTVKHAHHDFEMDQPGKDSWRHREAGATEVMVTSARRWVLQHERRGQGETEFEAIIGHMTPVDLLLVEGFKRHPHAKIEIFNTALGKPALYPDDPWIRGLAVIGPPPAGCELPVMEADDIGAIAAFVKAIAMPLRELA